jgi:hypothetical protein
LFLLQTLKSKTFCLINLKHWQQGKYPANKIIALQRFDVKESYFLCCLVFILKGHTVCYICKNNQNKKGKFEQLKFDIGMLVGSQVIIEHESTDQ